MVERALRPLGQERKRLEVTASSLMPLVLLTLSCAYEVS